MCLRMRITNCTQVLLDKLSDKQSIIKERKGSFSRFNISNVNLCMCLYNLSDVEELISHFKIGVSDYNSGIRQHEARKFRRFAEYV